MKLLIAVLLLGVVLAAVAGSMVWEKQLDAQIGVLQAQLKAVNRQQVEARVPIPELMMMRDKIARLKVENASLKASLGHRRRTEGGQD